MKRILLVDDEENIRITMSRYLTSRNYEVKSVSSGPEAVAVLNTWTPELMITDLRMEGMSGLELIERVRKSHPDTTIVIMTAYASVETAVAAMKYGAYDYVTKPFMPDQIAHLLSRVEQVRGLSLENVALKQVLQDIREPEELGSRNAKVQQLFEMARRVAASQSTVLVTGESGTGKSVLAKWIHKHSARAQRPFVDVNCATLSENLLESELFGHVKGSFTGAVRDKTGRLKIADGGTVFLDEIGDISLQLQTKLLRFLQDRQFEPVGSTKTETVDVRIVAATNRNLDAAVRSGAFREDLFYRLNVIEFKMPSLRDRPEDILALVESLLRRACAESGRAPLRCSPDVMHIFNTYRWPGNIRELKNTIERAVVLAHEDTVTVSDLPDRLLDPGTLVPPQANLTSQANMSLEDLERQYIQETLARSATLEEAASILGINLSTLWRKRRRYSLD
ncbi:MAG: sigma-54-dependent Fis family transcriptional regulator [Deltaproteobacteria bacterium]|nr:sigma-54-dependent Fis family transcriptional regulator [Deltaproteobacteria bacterium]